MNRLSPLIVRRTGSFAPVIEWPEPVLPMEQASRLFDDIRLFALGWMGGLVFFGTLLA